MYQMSVSKSLNNLLDYVVRERENEELRHKVAIRESELARVCVTAATLAPVGRAVGGG